MRQKGSLLIDQDLYIIRYKSILNLHCKGEESELDLLLTGAILRVTIPDKILQEPQSSAAVNWGGVQLKDI